MILAEEGTHTAWWKRADTYKYAQLIFDKSFYNSMEEGQPFQQMGTKTSRPL